MATAVRDMGLDRSRRQQVLADNLRVVQDRINQAAVRADRSPDDITLIAVTKYVDAEITRDLVAAGCQDLGENRPQAFWQKAEALSDLPIRWHFIGHLQRNKLRRTMPYVSLLHAADSVRLAEAIQRTCGELNGPPAEVLMEVNVSGDASKHGLPPDACEAFLELAATLEHVRVRGLMCMAGRTTGSQGARRDFETLRDLRDKLQRQFPEMDLSQLSMGMSGDFELAVAAGATLVRVGSLLFDGLL